MVIALIIPIKIHKKQLKLNFPLIVIFKTFKVLKLIQKISI
jgi:hypothetical protein